MKNWIIKRLQGQREHGGTPIDPEIVDDLGLEFDEWLAIGMSKSWIGPPVCYMHDGLPTSEDEDNMMDNGEDPCFHILRLYEDEMHRLTIEMNHSPSQWRRSGWE